MLAQVYSIILNSGNTFTYRYRGHLSGDTSAGLYSLQEDTISMHYQLNNYDSLLHAAEMKKQSPPIDILLSSRAWILRPQKIIWRNKRIHFLDKETGEINKHFKLKFYSH